MSEETPERHVEGPDYCAYTEYRTGDGADSPRVPATGEGATGLERHVWKALSGVEDPEMPVSVVDLGLIYGLAVDAGDATHVTVRMTLTYTGCPAREMLTADVREAVAGVEGVDEASVELVWSPEWTVEMVTDRGREALREFGVAI